VKNELLGMAKAVPDEKMKKFKGLAREIVNITCNLIEGLSKPTGRFI